MICPKCSYEIKPATRPQERYYWGVIVRTLSQELGYFPEEMHEILLMKFFGTKTIKDLNGNEIPKPLKRSKDLSTIEREEYHSNIRMWASSEMNIFIAKPNEV